jgi:methylated-DNA-[protein]-cysteine S-methyltransferase
VVTVRSETFGDAWFAVAENDGGSLLSSSFSLARRREAVEAVVKSLPTRLRNEVKDEEGGSSTLRMMYKLYSGETLKERPSLDMRFISPFRKNVYRVTGRIPRGFVSTYGIIAAKVGSRFAQRAVGNAMRSNPFTLFIPCHRVVPSTMNVGRYSLSSHPDSNSIIKRGILIREGVEFNGNEVSRKSVWSYKLRVKT